MVITWPCGEQLASQWRVSSLRCQYPLMLPIGLTASQQWWSLPLEETLCARAFLCSSWNEYPLRTSQWEQRFSGNGASRQEYWPCHSDRNAAFCHGEQAKDSRWQGSFGWIPGGGMVHFWYWCSVHRISSPCFSRCWEMINEAEMSITCQNQHHISISQKSRLWKI